MQLELFKRMAQYTDKDGKERTATNFFLKCGNELVPVEVKFFADRETGEDKNFRVRKTLLSAFAADLPEREQKKPAKREEQTGPQKETEKPKKTETMTDGDIPF